MLGGLVRPFGGGAAVEPDQASSEEARSGIRPEFFRLGDGGDAVTGVTGAEALRPRPDVTYAMAGPMQGGGPTIIPGIPNAVTIAAAAGLAMLLFVRR